MDDRLAGTPLTVLHRFFPNARTTVARVYLGVDMVAAVCVPYRR